MWVTDDGLFLVKVEPSGLAAVQASELLSPLTVPVLVTGNGYLTVRVINAAAWVETLPALETQACLVRRVLGCCGEITTAGDVNPLSVIDPYETGTLEGRTLIVPTDLHAGNVVNGKIIDQFLGWGTPEWVVGYWWAWLKVRGLEQCESREWVSLFGWLSRSRYDAVVEWCLGNLKPHEHVRPPVNVSLSGPVGSPEQGRSLIETLETVPFDTDRSVWWEQIRAGYLDRVSHYSVYLTDGH